MSMDQINTAELRRQKAEEDHKLSYEKPWPLSFRLAHGHFDVLLDTIDAQAATIAERDAEIKDAEDTATQATAFANSLARSLDGAKIKVTELLDAGDRLRADSARLTAELAAMTERAKAAEGWLTRFIKMMCLAAKDKDKVLRRMHIGAGDYMGSGYALLDAFNDIWDDFTEKADDELFKNVRRELDSECGPQAQAVEGAGHE